MPPKRKKSVRQKQKQRQSQRQSVTINLNKTTPAKKKRSGRGRLPPPSYQHNLFPPTIIQQQAPNIAVLENQISRLTSMIQEPTGIKQPTTPLSINTQAKTAEAQRLAGEQAEARRPGPTAGNFQAPPSVASTDSQDLEGFEVGPQQSETASMPFSMRDDLVREPPPVLLPRPSIAKKLEGTMKTKIEQLKQSLAERYMRPPDPAFNDRLVNPADPPKRGEAGQGEGGGGIPFAETRPLVGRPSKNTQQGIPIGTPSANPVKPPKPPKKETQKTTMMDFTKRTEQAGALTFM